MKLGPAEKAAAAVLARHQIRSAPVPVESIAKAEGLQVRYHELEDNVSGLLIDQAKNPVIAVNASHHLNRQRFTIAHELAHFRLHRGDPTVFVDNVLVHFRAESKQRPGFDIREAQANHFAACLLMPERLLKADIGSTLIDISDDSAVRALASKYQVSVQALVIRLERLGLVSH